MRALKHHNESVEKKFVTNILQYKINIKNKIFGEIAIIEDQKEVRI